MLKQKTTGLFWGGAYAGPTGGRPIVAAAAFKAALVDWEGLKESGRGVEKYPPPRPENAEGTAAEITFETPDALAKVSSRAPHR
jgi:hypothetical protein